MPPKPNTSVTQAPLRPTSKFQSQVSKNLGARTGIYNQPTAAQQHLQKRLSVKKLLAQRNQQNFQEGSVAQKQYNQKLNNMMRESYVMPSASRTLKNLYQAPTSEASQFTYRQHLQNKLQAQAQSVKGSSILSQIKNPKK